MTTYKITVNETETATTSNFDTMFAFVDSIRGINSWSLEIVEDGKLSSLGNSHPINAGANFYYCVETCRMGR